MEKYDLFLKKNSSYQRNLNVRCYLRPEYTLEQFFEKCLKLDYIILCWFYNLPHIDEGEDIDILISDDDYYEMEKYMQNEKTDYKFDIYRVSYCDFGCLIPYIHPEFAKTLLMNKIIYKSLYKVPSNYFYFMVLIYHIVYHKGISSDIRIDNKEKLNDDDRYIKELDYIINQNPEIKSITNRNDFSLSYFHELLCKNGYSPNIEYIRMFSRKNSKCTFLKSLYNFTEFKSNILVVFVFRSLCYDNDFIESSVQKILKIGFQILDIRSNNGKLNETRCGNWGSPYPICGGNPHIIVIGFLKPGNYEIINVSGYPQYKIIYNTKCELREDFNQKYNIKTNIIHSSDDYLDSKLYINKFGKDYYNFIENKMNNFDKIS